MQSPTSSYARTLRPHLPEEIFAPTPGRLLWLVLHVGVVGLGIWAIAAGGLAWPIMALISIPIGLAFAGMAFVAHEVLHGAVVRSMWKRRLVGWLGFLPFLISPRHWASWHNRLHHGNTMIPGVDPDAYPTLEHYRSSRVARVADRLSFGGRRLLGVVTLLVGLTVQSMEVLFHTGPRARYLSSRQYVLALAETAAAIGVWTGLAVWLGPAVLVFGWLIPFVLGSAVVMAFIVTNHSLSPMNEVHDPLTSSLSVTVPSWFSAYTLQFGLHVEHHLFPTVSGRHAPKIQDLITEHYPERYQSMPLTRALARIFETGRVHKDASTLIDPRSGLESRTLGSV